VMEDLSNSKNDWVNVKVDKWLLKTTFFLTEESRLATVLTKSMIAKQNVENQRG
jgi:hypothetical protein